MGLTWQMFLRSYLFAFMFVLSLSLGALFFVVLQHCVKAGWSVAIRRIGEGVASNLMWLWVLFIPIALGMWTEQSLRVAGTWAMTPRAIEVPLLPHADVLAGAGRSVPGDLGLGGTVLRRTSAAQDLTGEVSLTRRMERAAPAAMILYALSQSYGSMDWVMTLDSMWFSTMFPVYFFAASCCGFFALQILLAFNLQRMGRLTHQITPEHYQDMGKLLFAFGIVFWAYIAFSQYMLIWYANIPEELPFYLTRQVDGWFWVSMLLLFGHFAGPFVGIISRHPKRQPAMLALAATWMLVMAIADMYWLVRPDVPEELIHNSSTYKEFAAKAVGIEVGWNPNILDLTCLLAPGVAFDRRADVPVRLGVVSLLIPSTIRACTRASRSRTSESKRRNAETSKINAPRPTHLPFHARRLRT